MIPTVAECFLLMEQYGMLEHIRAHSIVVARIAELLVHALERDGCRLSAELALAGALLHDIAKTPCLHSNDNHAQVGREICRRHHLEETATLVGEHIRLEHGVSAQGCTEKEIVFYADKRVNHDRVVSLEERLAYILERYGHDNPERRQLIVQNFKQCRQVEEKLFARLDFGPEQVARLVAAESAFPFTVSLPEGR